MNMKLYLIPALFRAACATTPESTMSPEELAECLQPNRRVVVEVVGRTVKPPAKKPAAPPEAKPEAKAEAAAAPKPEAKPPKPEFVAYEETFYVQGNSAFDPGSAVLKEGGRAELLNLRLQPIHRRSPLLERAQDGHAVLDVADDPVDAVVDVLQLRRLDPPGVEDGVDFVG